MVSPIPKRALPEDEEGIARLRQNALWASRQARLARIAAAAASGGLVFEEVYKETNGGDTSATWAYTLGVTPDAGDLLLYIFWTEGIAYTTHTEPTGWTELYEGDQIYIIYKIADGTEADTDVVDPVAAAGGAANSGQCFRISGAGTPLMGTVSKTDLTPPLYAPAPGEASYAWLACIAYARRESMVDNPGVATYPTGFTTNTQYSQNYLPDTPNRTSSGRGGTGIGYKVETAEDAGGDAFIMDAAAGLSGFSEAFIIAIPEA